MPQLDPVMIPIIALYTYVFFYVLNFNLLQLNHTLPILASDTTHTVLATLADIKWSIVAKHSN